MNNDERTGGSTRAGGHDSIITHDDGDMIELPAPGGLAGEGGQAAERNPERDLGAEPAGRSAGRSVVDATGGDTEMRRRRGDPVTGPRDLGGRGGRSGTTT